MTEEKRFKPQSVVSIESNTLFEKLKHYFHHPTFKSDLQKNAIITILKRKCIKIVSFLFVLTKQML